MVTLLNDRILEELLFRGPRTVDELSEDLQRTRAEINSALASLYRKDSEPQLIEYLPSGKIGRVSHG